MIIGLTGPEGAGKSTAAQLYARKFGLEIVPFARPIKAMLTALGVPDCNLYGTPAEKAAPLALLGGRSARDAMQTLGTEWGRDMISPSLWSDAWAARAGQCRGGVVADDIRTPSEAALVKQLGGRVIQIVRSLDDVTRVPRHATENFAAIPFDVRVVNDTCQHNFAMQLIAAYRRAK